MAIGFAIVLLAPAPLAVPLAVVQDLALPRSAELAESAPAPPVAPTDLANGTPLLAAKLPALHPPSAAVELLRRAAPRFEDAFLNVTRALGHPEARFAAQSRELRFEAAQAGRDCRRNAPSATERALCLAAVRRALADEERAMRQDLALARERLRAELAAAARPVCEDLRAAGHAVGVDASWLTVGPCAAGANPP